MNNTTSLIVGVCVLSAVGLLVYVQTAQAPTIDVAGNGAPAAPLDSTMSAQKGSYTASEVAQHATPSDCWASINGKVYDLTAWVAQHPGGERAITRLCGTDGSEAFNGQHGGGAQPASTLKGYEIGTLAL